MTPRIYPMGPILQWTQWCGIEFTMPLVLHVERRGREVVLALLLELGR